VDSVEHGVSNVIRVTTDERRILAMGGSNECTTFVQFTGPSHSALVLNLGSVRRLHERDASDE